MQDLKKHIQSFYPFAKKRFGFNKPPRIFLSRDEENAKNVLGKTAFYDPDNFSITLYVAGRHPKDILRSLAHELVHHAQNCRGEFDDSSIASAGEDYAQKDPHLRAMEEEANKEGSMCLRDWTDSINYGGEQTMNLNEKTLRASIREALRRLKLVTEDAIDDAPKEEAAEAAQGAAGAAKQSSGQDPEEAEMSAEETAANIKSERVRKDIPDRADRAKRVKPLEEDSADDDALEEEAAYKKDKPELEEEDIKTVDDLNEWYYNKLSKTLVERFTRK